MTHLPETERVANILAALPADARALCLATLEHWADRDPRTGPLGWQLGLHYTDWAPGRTSCRIDVGPEHHNSGQVAHGGVIFTLADSAMG